MPEPVSGYLPSGEFIAVVFDPMLDKDLHSSHGAFEPVQFRRDAFTVAAIEGVHSSTVYAPNRVGKALHVQVDRASKPRFAWRALDPPPGPGDISELCSEAFQELESLSQKHQARAGRGRRNRSGIQLWNARTFLEEGPKRGEQRRVWVFFLATLKKDGSINDRHIVLSQALSQSVRALRVPELAALRDCWIVVVGAGALGAPTVGELARAGVGHIDVIDDDRFDLNNSVRHVLPIDAAGELKAMAVASWAGEQNPFSEVKGHYLTAGEDPHDEVKSLVDAADVVIDATGLHHVTRVLHRQCSINDVPLVSAGLSLGGYGGRVLVLKQPRPCLDCFLSDESIPRPNEEVVEEGVTPYGCSHPAASCAGFDSTELASNIARTAVRATSATLYPPLDFDWAVVNFRPPGPRWAQGELESFSKCPWCAD